MNWLLDLLFPKRCVSCGRLGAYICKQCFSQVEFIEKPICPVCQRQAVGGKTHPGCRGKYRLDGLVVACRYKGPIRRAIQKIKYRWVWDIEKILTKMLIDALWRYELPQKITLIPIPLHPRRLRWRGFNQSELVAKSLAQQFRESFDSSLLLRHRETKTQVGLSKKERKENIRDAFGVVRKLYGNIVLVDDVYTTGTTMQEAAKVLKRAGAKSVWGMVIALD